MLSNKDLDLVSELLERYREPAILLYSPFPPQEAPKVRSKIGGLPNLPADRPWPMGKFRGEVIPLHFFAQIDCSELPRLDRRLPIRGMLFFFGCDMEEQVWGMTEPQDDVRVLYVEKVLEATPKREPPKELPPIGGRYASSDGRIAADGALPGEDGPNIHVEWPLVATKIDSWPNSDAWDDIGGLFKKAFPGRSLAFRDLLSAAFNEREKYNEALRRNKSIAEPYDERVRFKRLDAFVAATGIVNKHRAWNLQWARSTGMRYDEPWPANGVRFPQLGIMIDRLARHIINAALSYRDRHSRELGAENEQRIQTIVDAGMLWIERAREIGFVERPSAEDADALNTWLVDIHGQRPHAPMPSDALVVNIDTNRQIRAALVDTINYLATRAPEKFPARYYDVLAADFTPFSQGGGNAVDGVRHHQTLGHVPSSQDVKSIDDPKICLLRLSSDYIRKMSFGDAGECTFWIMPSDLVARRFDKAWGEIVSH